MKPLSTALVAILLVLLISLVYAGQITESQVQGALTWSAQPENVPFGRSLSSQPARISIGGSPPETSGISWGGFSDHPARSLWGGYPLNTSKAVTTIQSSTAPSSLGMSLLPPSCEESDKFCVLQHQFPFQRPFSPTFNTAVESSYLYGTTQEGALAPHHGVEILNPTGTPVLAVEDGTVVVAGDDAHRVFGPWKNFY
jgi:murein DD-endopeptidase MepM/ murein hydrolase activator NlpD